MRGEGGQTIRTHVKCEGSTRFGHVDPPVDTPVKCYLRKQDLNEYLRWVYVQLLDDTLDAIHVAGTGADENRVRLVVPSNRDLSLEQTGSRTELLDTDRFDEFLLLGLDEVAEYVGHLARSGIAKLIQEGLPLVRVERVEFVDD